jgi:hypothetical protein
LGVDSVGLAKAVIGSHVAHDGSWVRSPADKAIKGQLRAVSGLECIRLCCCPVHPILLDLLLDGRNAKLHSAGILCVKSALYPFGSCPPSGFQCFGLKSSVHRQCPICFSVEMECQELREVDLKKESAVFGDLLWGNFQEDIDLLNYLLGLLVAKISVRFIMERDIPKNSLRVRNLEELGDELFDPVLPI